MREQVHHRIRSGAPIAAVCCCDPILHERTRYAGWSLCRTRLTRLVTAANIPCGVLMAGTT
jgi:hypothetical protein